MTLLLYMLLHRNPNVKEYIMKRSDIQLLVIPILRILYHAPDNTSHHIYMSLIILLILSEDEFFNKRVHEIVSLNHFLQIINTIALINIKTKLYTNFFQTLKGITWYTERSISEISLGGLLILVVIRTIQYNMLKMRVSINFPSKPLIY